MMTELTEDVVREYLRFNRGFLEDFILRDIPQETLERLLIRRAQKEDLSKWKVNVITYETVTYVAIPNFCRHEVDCLYPKPVLFESLNLYIMYSLIHVLVFLSVSILLVCVQ